jgi:hypothetical protein
MRTLYTFQTDKGMARIDQNPKNRLFHAIFNEESLGSYPSPEQAAEELSAGCTFALVSGIEIETLGIPSELGSWIRELVRC